jgi:hypothetical protein
MDIVELNNYLQAVAHVVTIGGFPAAIALFMYEKHKERREREYGTYNALDEKYIHFLELCLDKPDLDILDLPHERPKKPTPNRPKREQILYLILISILERAFLMYHDQSSEVKARQWEGWEAYMKDFCARKNFRNAWPDLGPQFDTKFVRFMDDLIEKIDPTKVTRLRVAEASKKRRSAR